MTELISPKIELHEPSMANPASHSPSSHLEKQLLRRWRQLWYLGLAWLVLLLVMLMGGWLLDNSRQAYTKQLQTGLNDHYLYYQQQASALRRQTDLWQRKQDAIKQWYVDKQASTAPIRYLLLAQQVAVATGGQVAKLVWQADQLHIYMQSDTPWHSIQSGLQSLPWASLMAVQQDQAVSARYHFQVGLQVAGRQQ